MDYTITLRHDEGVVSIRTSASSEEAAVRKVLKAELAPRSSIISVTPFYDPQRMADIEETRRTAGREWQSS
jgi:hypothetical protein